MMNSLPDPFRHLRDQMPMPPLDMVMPTANAAVVLANWVLLAAVALWMLSEARRTKSLVPLLCLVGGVVASLQEPIYDIVGAVWYPSIGQTPVFKAFGVSVSGWLPPAYAWYIGGQGYLMLRRFQSGITTRQIWLCYVAFWLTNFVLEMPGLMLGIYAYYGDQPFKVFGFPLWMAMSNSVMPILLGLMLHKFDALLRGPRVFLVLPLVPMAIGCSQISIAWPTWLALNSGGGPALTHVAALVSLALSMMMVYLAGETYKGLAPAGGSRSKPPQQDVVALDPRGVTTPARHGRAGPDRALGPSAAQ